MFNYRMVIEEENGVTLYKLYDCAMTDDYYDNIKPLISFLGGCWREKDKAFVFAYDPEALLYDMFNKYETGFFKRDTSFSCAYRNSDFDGSLKMLPFAYRLWQEKIQFYPTPEELAERVVNLCEIKETDTVLEPSAGQGGLIKYIPECREVIAVEPDFGNCNIIKKFYDITAISGTFEAVCETSDLSGVTKIVMNPPFSDFRDLKHVMMAYNILQTGGCMTAIISENNLYYDGAEVSAFKEFLKTVNYQMFDVPFGTFKSAGTMVYTKILKISK